MVSFEQAVGQTPRLVALACQVALAAWLLYLDRRKPANVVFSVVLLLRSGVVAMNVLRT